MASSEYLELSQSPSRRVAAGRVVPVAQADMMGGVGRWVVLVLYMQQPAVTLLATRRWGWASVCGVGLFGMATQRRFISETCRAAWVARGRRLSGGCCRLDLDSLKRSACHCH